MGLIRYFLFFNISIKTCLTFLFNT